jgi:hypothetical protein
MIAGMRAAATSTDVSIRWMRSKIAVVRAGG